MEFTKADYYNMKLRQLLAICKGTAKYAGYSRFCSKAGLIDHMVKCDEAEVQAVQAVEQSDAVTPGATGASGRSAFSMEAADTATSTQVITEAGGIEEKIEEPAPTAKPVNSLPATVAGDVNNLMDEEPRQLIPAFFTAGDIDEDDEGDAGEPARLPNPTPEFPPAAQSTIKDWLDNREFRAQFQSLISCRSITIEKLWTLAETFTKQGGVRYLQVLNLDSQESWFIHWDTQWKSFKDACRLFENVLARCTAVDEILPPKPKPATYPTSTKYKMGERLCQLMGWNFEQWVRNASGENDSDRGSDPRRERVDEVCMNCNDTHLCPGRNFGCGCKSETDCPSLGWCVACELPAENLEPAVWEEVSA